jgi:hypothetical protein
LSEGKTKVVGPPRRKNEGGAGQNFLKVTQNNLRKAKRRSNEGPAKENPGLRWTRAPTRRLRVGHVVQVQVQVQVLVQALVLALAT